MPTKPRSPSSARQRDIRGSTQDRARRRAWLLATFSPELGPALADCHLTLSPACLGQVDAATLTVDRIQPGGPYIQGNIQPACRPCQQHQAGIIGPERKRAHA
jgi:hypothetical protein